MKPADFEFYSKLLKEKSGLVLTPDKTYLLESRLSPVAKQWEFGSLDEMTVKMQGISVDPKMMNDVIEAMTTNETSFFRDTRPFDVFRDHLLKYMRENRPNKRLRIWCAAASSGQEPYTIAMILKELEAQNPGWTYQITATDISHDILDLAREGLYSQFEVQRGLPIQLLMKYFTQQDGQKWQISDDLKRMIKYDHFNLLTPMTALGKFDIVFCRNVLIYFDEATKADVLQRMAAQMEPDGLLMLGGAETVLGITDAFKPVKDLRGVYAKPDSVHFQKSEDAA
ncbi:MAG: CheR family methyltransferase [Alphaproteobacteria bacterium]